jgi:ribose 5-phosphate isomerase B
MKIFIGADHGGFALKEKLKPWLVEQGFLVEDGGAFMLDPADDYPIYTEIVAKKVLQDPENQRGILLCRSGAGVVIAANKLPGIRAVSVSSAEAAQLAREDNDANILGIGADMISEDEMKKIILKFLQTPFSQEERHKRRLEEIEAEERKYTQSTS